MSYQLRHGETLGDNIRRICSKQIEAAIAVAKDEVKTDDTPVHEMRKHLKKARAAVRLVRKEIEAWVPVPPISTMMPLIPLV